MNIYKKYDYSILATHSQEFFLLYAPPLCLALRRTSFHAFAVVFFDSPFLPYSFPRFLFLRVSSLRLCGYILGQLPFSPVHFPDFLFLCVSSLRLCVSAVAFPVRRA